ncbi:MAG: MBOAT family protein [Acidobacteria bacterium]|nr:MAG: MBOAT family protein [Acidobacteriota bacterium]
MLFNSYIFLFVFLPIALTMWWTLSDNRWRLLGLTLASYYFYAWWDWRFLPLMIASTNVDYLAGRKISESDDPGIKKRWLVCSLSFNLALLGIFKYYGFFASSVDAVARSMGWPAIIPVVNLVLPIGISFYTFNSMSYTIDVYRGVVRPARSLLHFSAFVAMFPHLIAGPIVRYSDIENQLNNLKKKLPSGELAVGIFFFVTGLAKKLIVADRIARPVNIFFESSAGNGAIPAWLAVLGYTFQLYFDFSGYSDMAVGLAHLLGFQFPQNFNSPYKAVSISDFWRRWHISLSTWLRDYLFIPLGGSRLGTARTLFNLTVTMFLGGLWHGANWTFVIWGLYHGVLLAASAGYRQVRGPNVPDAISRPLTFLAVVFGWVFFRSANFGQAADIFGQMFGKNGLGAWTMTMDETALLLIAAVTAFTLPNTWEFRLRPLRTYAYGLAVLFVCAVLLIGKESPFLYFQF